MTGSVSTVLAGYIRRANLTRQPKITLLDAPAYQFLRIFPGEKTGEHTTRCLPPPPYAHPVWQKSKKTQKRKGRPWPCVHGQRHRHRSAANSFIPPSLPARCSLFRASLLLSAPNKNKGQFALPPIPRHHHPRPGPKRVRLRLRKPCADLPPSCRRPFALRPPVVAVAAALVVAPRRALPLALLH